MAVIMVVVVVMVRMIVPEKPGTDEIDDQTDDGDQNGFVKVDVDRRAEAPEAFPADQKRDQRQNDGAGKPRQIAELAGAEGKARIMRVPARIEIGQRRDQHRRRMGGHMPAIGGQRHGAIKVSGGDLDYHHRHRDGDHHPGPLFVALVIFSQKEMIVPG